MSPNLFYLGLPNIHTSSLDHLTLASVLDQSWDHKQHLHLNSTLCYWLQHKKKGSESIRHKQLCRAYFIRSESIIVLY
uniref:Uncharacterized protein n=1 Tax=Arundo donax TaxID=35708 RepID=A0A0A9GMA7_ARUDO